MYQYKLVITISFENAVGGMHGIVYSIKDCDSINDAEAIFKAKEILQNYDLKPTKFVLLPGERKHTLKLVFTKAVLWRKDTAKPIKEYSAEEIKSIRKITPSMPGSYEDVYPPRGNSDGDGHPSGKDWQGPNRNKGVVNIQGPA